LNLQILNELDDKLKLIVIAGPTAVGKTRLALEMARELNCDIMSADSRQLYKEMNIGTAKPSSRELKMVPHYFINHKSIHEYYSAGRFEEDVISLLEKYDKSSMILVGGSGLYIKAVCEGIDEMPDPDLDFRSEMMKRLETESLAGLVEELKRQDYQSWETIDLNNPKRVIRALEVIRQTGKKYSDIKSQSKKTRNFEVLKIGLDMPRDMLFNRINIRVDQMITQGLMDEVRSLWQWRHLTALQTVGYSEFFDYLDGKYDFEEAVRLCKRNTRRYAKRQLTWFRKDPAMQWYSPADTVAILKRVHAFVLDK
jgi:tRNA dimethylallyltransferase